MNDYVPKPIERPYLLATIIRWLPASPAALNQPALNQSTWRNRSGAAGAATALSPHKGVGLKTATAER
jgi:two-component system sensor histidine kinase/response regulator